MPNHAAAPLCHDQKIARNHHVMEWHIAQYIVVLQPLMQHYSTQDIPWFAQDLEMMLIIKIFKLKILCELEETENVARQSHQLSQLNISAEAGT